MVLLMQLTVIWETHGVWSCILRRGFQCMVKNSFGTIGTILAFNSTISLQFPQLSSLDSRSYLHSDFVMARWVKKLKNKLQNPSRKPCNLQPHQDCTLCCSTPFSWSIFEERFFLFDLFPILVNDPDCFPLLIRIISNFRLKIE